MQNATDYAAEVAEAVREIIAALTYTHKTEKRAERLRKIAERAEELRPVGRDAGNVIPMLDPARKAALAEAQRRRAALSALILQAVEAERKELRQASYAGR